MTSLLVAMAFSIGADTQSVDDFFKEFAAKRDHIQTLSAEFVQNNITPDETKSSGGQIAFVKPKQLKFEYRDPKIIYAIDGQRVYEYEADLEQVQAYDVEDSAQADAFFIAFDNNATRLRDAYDVSLLEAEAGACGQRVLKLVPKKPKSDDNLLSQPYKEIKLYLRQDDLLPCRIQAISDDESSVVVDIDHYKINEEGSIPSITFHVPEGTKIIVNEANPEIAGQGGKDLPDARASAPKPAEK